MKTITTTDLSNLSGFDYSRSGLEYLDDDDTTDLDRGLNRLRRFFYENIEWTVTRNLSVEEGNIIRLGNFKLNANRISIDWHPEVGKVSLTKLGQDDGVTHWAHIDALIDALRAAAAAGFITNHGAAANGHFTENFWGSNPSLPAITAMRKISEQIVTHLNPPPPKPEADDYPIWAAIATANNAREDLHGLAKIADDNRIRFEIAGDYATGSLWGKEAARIRVEILCQQPPTPVAGEEIITASGVRWQLIQDGGEHPYYLCLGCDIAADPKTNHCPGCGGASPSAS